MNTRSGRTAQFADEGRSAPSLAPGETNRKQSKGRGKGAGAVAAVTSGPGGSSSAAAVLPGAGKSDEMPATAQSHQMVRYEHDDQDLGAVQTPIFSVCGKFMTMQLVKTCFQFMTFKSKYCHKRITEY